MPEFSGGGRTVSHLSKLNESRRHPPGFGSSLGRLGGAEVLVRAPLIVGFPSRIARLVGLLLEVDGGFVERRLVVALLEHVRLPVHRRERTVSQSSAPAGTRPLPMMLDHVSEHSQFQTDSITQWAFVPKVAKTFERPHRKHGGYPFFLVSSETAKRSLGLSLRVNRV
jgi:hypothetical protein